jgi:hypothetical protein
VSLAKVILAAIALFIGVPLLLLLAAATGVVGWIVAAIVMPVAVLAVILWLGWFRRQDDDGPFGGSDRMYP